MAKIAFLLLVLLLIPTGADSILAQTTGPLYHLQEDFESGVIPGGWGAVNFNIVNDPSAEPPGTHYLSQTGKMAAPEGRLTTRVFDLTNVQNATLFYRGSRVGPVNTLRIYVVQGTVATEITGITTLPSTTSWETFHIPIPSAFCGKQIQIRFITRVQVGTVKLDDIAVYSPILRVATPVLTMIAPPGGEVVKTVSATAYGGSQTVTPSLVVGTAFSLQNTDPVALDDSASTVFTIRFHPPTDGYYRDTLNLANGSGSTTKVLITGSTPAVGSLGFMSDQTEILESAVVEVPLVLRFERESGIQGIQFTVSWDTALVSLIEIVRGESVLDANAWRLESHPEYKSNRVVLVGLGVNRLNTGVYDSLLVFRFYTAPVETSPGVPVQLTLSGLVGSLSVDTGDDAVLEAIPDEHTFQILNRWTAFQASETLEGGSGRVGTVVQSRIEVANPGNDTLVVSEVATSNYLFGIAPVEALIPPEGAQEFTVAFEPTFTSFGKQTTDLVFVQPEDRDTIRVHAAGTGGRGDCLDDGVVDVGDLVGMVDYAVGRETPSTEQISSSDLYPFGASDGAVDVRDLTVMSQALARGNWPDQVDLPLEEMLSGASKQATTVTAWVRIVSDTLEVRLENAVRIRAAEIILRTDRLPSRIFAHPHGSGASLLHGIESLEHKSRFILYQSSGHTIEPGRYSLAAVICPGCTSAELAYAVAITEDEGRIPILLRFGTGTGIDPEEPAPTFMIGAPYPNPVTGPTLRIPYAVPEAGELRLDIYDLLGRRIDGMRETVPVGRGTLVWSIKRQGVLASGTYYLKLSMERDVAWRAIVVVN